MTTDISEKQSFENDFNKAEQMEFEIYQTYQEVVAPLIITLEVYDTEYPIEVFNEIRSMFLHLSRFRVQGDIKEVSVCKRHLKRAILDCYKYLCVSISEKISKLRYDYRKIDLSLANNGKFLSSLNCLENDARNKLINAKKFEITQRQLDEDKRDENSLYNMYEEAYNAYIELDKLWKNSGDDIAFACSKSKKDRGISIASVVFGVIGTIVGIGGIVVSILLK